VALGWALFAESVQLGLRVIPEIIGVALIGAGSIGLANAPSLGRGWDTPGDGRTREGKDAHIPMGHEH
jgi:hypothetical protein